MTGKSDSVNMVVVPVAPAPADDYTQNMGCYMYLGTTECRWRWLTGAADGDTRRMTSLRWGIIGIGRRFVRSDILAFRREAWLVEGARPEPSRAPSGIDRPEATMREGYFHRVQRETATRVWVNNPTAEDLCASIGAGAVSGTTNPTYGSVLLKREPEYVEPIIDEVFAVESDLYRAADAIYQRISRRFMEGFLPQWESSGGAWGFVTMQDDPPPRRGPGFDRGRRPTAPRGGAELPRQDSGDRVGHGGDASAGGPQHPDVCHGVLRRLAGGGNVRDLRESRGRQRQHAALLHHAHHGHAGRGVAGAGRRAGVWTSHRSCCPWPARSSRGGSTAC